MRDTHLSNVQVVTDHRGWPVAVNEGSVWWMVAEVEPTKWPEEVASAQHGEGGFFQLQLTNGRIFIASHDEEKRQWTIAGQKH
jgi:hypothetical protein